MRTSAGHITAAWENNRGPDTRSKLDFTRYRHPHLADDLLRGADEIATFIFGERASRRKVYYLAECTRLPVFRLGSMLCARRRVLMKCISN